MDTFLTGGAVLTAPASTDLTLNAGSGTPASAVLGTAGAITLTAANSLNINLTTASGSGVVIANGAYFGSSNTQITLRGASTSGCFDVAVPNVATSNSILYRLQGGTQTHSTGTANGIKFSTTYNQTSTAASTDFQLVRIETALGSGSHNFVDLFSGAAGTTERFSISNTGATTIFGAATLKFGATAAATIGVSADTTAGVLTFTSTTTGGYSLPSAGGTTITSLAGTGSRAVLADANGLLSAPVSDETWKTDFRSLPESYGLETVMKLVPAIFKYKDAHRFGKQDYIGFGARATAAVLPEVTGQDRDGTYYLTDEKLTAVLVKAVQQQQEKIERLESQLAGRS